MRYNSAPLNTFAEVVKITNHTELSNVLIAWYSLNVTHWICWSREGDESHWTVRCRAHLILAECYSLDFPSSWRWRTSLNCELPSSPDTRRVLLTGFVSMAQKTASESKILDLYNLAWSVRFLQFLWNFFMWHCIRAYAYVTTYMFVCMCVRVYTWV